MKKIYGLIAAMVLAFVMLVPSAAFAAPDNHHCQGLDVGAGACVDMNWHKQADGTGYILDSVHLYVSGDKSCLDGARITAIIYRADNTAKWSSSASLGPGNNWTATRSPDLAFSSNVYEGVTFGVTYSGCSGHPAGNQAVGGNTYYDIP